MNFKISTFVIVTAVILSGCASLGNETLRAETEASVQTKIIEGKTTKAEVRQMFGSPLKTTFTDGGLEIWSYEFSKVSADAINYIPIVNIFGASSTEKKKSLVVLFAADGVTKRVSMSESDVKLKTGLLNQ